MEKQNSKLAETLGLNDIKMNKQDRFAHKEDNLEEEIVQAKKLSDRVAQELKEKIRSSLILSNSRKTWRCLKKQCLTEKKEP